MLAAPATWAASVLDVNYAGSSFNATAGPAGGTGGFGGGGQPVAAQSAKLAERFASGDFTPGAGAGGATGARGAPGGIGASATTTLTTAEQRLYDYVSAHRDGASYLMAVGSWEEASPTSSPPGRRSCPWAASAARSPPPPWRPLSTSCAPASSGSS